MWGFTSLQWSKVVQGRNIGEPMTHKWPWLTDAGVEPRLTCVVWSNRWATVAHIAEDVKASSDRKMPEYTVYRSLCIGMHSHRPVRVSMLTHSLPKASTTGTSIRTWSRSNGRRWHGWWNTFSFTLCGWPCVCVCRLPGEHVVRFSNFSDTAEKTYFEHSNMPAIFPQSTLSVYFDKDEKSITLCFIKVQSSEYIYITNQERSNKKKFEINIFPAHDLKRRMMITETRSALYMPLCSLGRHCIYPETHARNCIAMEEITR